jgi:hypothetical protein
LIGLTAKLASIQPQKERYMTGKAVRCASVSFHFGLAALLVSLASPAIALGQDDQSAKLVQIVQGATAKYINVNNATAAGYGPVLGCVSGSDHGAMGIHYVNGGLLTGETLLGNGQLDPTRPQALIYEPQSNGEMKLVGVEFIILASALPAGAAPEVDGHLMLYIDGPTAARPDATPNRYGLPALFEMHVWAWRDNPQGSFVDWNNQVTCDSQ